MSWYLPVFTCGHKKVQEKKQEMAHLCIIKKCTFWNTFGTEFQLEHFLVINLANFKMLRKSVPKVFRKELYSKSGLPCFFQLASDTQMSNAPHPHTTIEVHPSAPSGTTLWPGKMLSLATTPTMGLRRWASNNSPAITSCPRGANSCRAMPPTGTGLGPWSVCANISLLY